MYAYHYRYYIPPASGATTRQLTGASTGTSSTAGAASRVRPVTGASTGGSSTAGSALRLRQVAGVSTGTSSTSGAATGARRLAGSSTGTSSTAGTLGAAGIKQLSGASAGTSGTAGILAAARALVAASSGDSASAGTLAGVRPLAGASTGGGTTSGTLRRLVPAVALAGLSTSGSATMGALTVGAAIVPPTWCTVGDVVLYTGQTVTAAELYRAGLVLELHLGRTYADMVAGPDGPRVGRRDRQLIAQACAYQASWTRAQPDMFTRLDLDGAGDSQSGGPQFKDRALTLAPLARRALQRVSWLRSRAIQVRSPMDGLEISPNPLAEINDRVEDWLPLG